MLDKITEVLIDVVAESTDNQPLHPDTKIKVRGLLSDLLTIRNLSHGKKIRGKTKEMRQTLDFLRRLVVSIGNTIESLTEKIEAARAKAADGGG